jgi:hypothetical protein
MALAGNTVVSVASWVRRAEAIKKHLSAMICEPLELQRLFNQWLGPSEDLKAIFVGASE